MIYETDMSEVIEAISYLNEFSKYEGLFLVPNLPEHNTATVNAPDAMDIESFLTLAKLLDCKIVYYETTLFTTDDFEEYREYLNKKLRVEDNTWYKRINEFVSIKIIFYYDGVSHVFRLKEACLKELEQELKDFNEK